MKLIWYRNIDQEPQLTNKSKTKTTKRDSGVDKLPLRRYYDTSNSNYLTKIFWDPSSVWPNQKVKTKVLKWFEIEANLIHTSEYGSSTPSIKTIPYLTYIKNMIVRQ